MKLWKPIYFLICGIGVMVCGFFIFMQLAWGEAKAPWNEVARFALIGDFVFVIIFLIYGFFRKTRRARILLKIGMTLYASFSGILFAWLLVYPAFEDGLRDIYTFFPIGELCMVTLLNLTAIIFVAVIWADRGKTAP